MVTYEEARQFRETAGAPLTWEDEDVPPPPLDRIEFTRLILEYAKEAKLEEIRWLSHVGMYSPVPRESQGYNISKEREIEKLKYFQQLIQRHIISEIFIGIPMVGHSGYKEDGTHFTGERSISWGEYIEKLEARYYKPWFEAWEYGASLRSRLNLFECFVNLFSRWNSWSEWGSENHCPYRDLNLYQLDCKISETLCREIIFDFRDLIDWEMGVEIVFFKGIDVYKNKRNLIYMVFIFEVLMVFILIYFGIAKPNSVYGVIILSVVVISGGYYFYQMFSNKKEVWANPDMTFEDVIETIVADRSAMWLFLQQKYNEPVTESPNAPHP